MPKVDETGKTVRISQEDMVRLDGISLCRRVIRDGVVYLQFRDNNRERTVCRGTPIVEIPALVLLKKIMPAGMGQAESYDA